MQTAFPGPIFLAVNFVQTTIKVQGIAEHFFRLCQARSPQDGSHKQQPSPHLCLHPIMVALSCKPVCMAPGGEGALGTIYPGLIAWSDSSTS